MIGVVLLMLTLLLSYTGYLLPWDQLAFWAITVGSNLISAVPVFGPKIRFLMLGGNTVNANALLRFYVLHCVILPLLPRSSSRFISGGFARTAEFIQGKAKAMSEPNVPEPNLGRRRTSSRR